MQRNLRFLFTFLLCSGSALLAVFSFAAPSSPSPSSKIAAWVLDHTANGNQAEFLVVLSDQANLSHAAALPTKAEKGRYVRDTLWNKAQGTQAPLLQWLRANNIEHRSYYIVNMIWVRGTLEIAQALAARPDVARIEGNPEIHNVLPQPDAATPAPDEPQQVTAIEPGITYTHAPQVWAMGYTGQGIVVAGGDTGYRWDHTALINHYRGWNGTSADHNYNWHDSIHSNAGANPCGFDSPFPCDDQGHGTHTMGTAIGDDGAGNQIGMAPGAKWIGCRNMDANNGTPTRYIECMEFFLAPYPVGGTTAQGDPSKAPDISTNSWGCPASEGCSVNDLKAAVEAQKAAGILMVAAAGNGGNNGVNDCSTVSDQPGTLEAVYSIGALNTGADTAASFTSKGPVTADGSNRLKPNLSAPGTNTRSSYYTSTSSYASLSGTSMATPHVAGAVALIWSAQPSLRNDVDATENILNQTAVHLNPPTGSLCDSIGTTYPNNTFGYGRLDVKAAVDRALLLPRLVSAVSRKHHSGINDLDINLPFGGSDLGIECRADGGNPRLVFTFNNNVVSGNASVTSGTATAGSPTFSGKTMTVPLTGVSNQQTITVTLSGVTDNSSQVLRDTDVKMGVLFGDVTGSKRTDSGDVTAVRNHTVSIPDQSSCQFDVNLSGRIDSGDVTATRNATVTILP